MNRGPSKAPASNPEVPDSEQSRAARKSSVAYCVEVF